MNGYINAQIETEGYIDENGIPVHDTIARVVSQGKIT